MNPKKISTESLYIICDYDYFGEPSCDGYVYYSKEEAQKAADEINQQFTNQKPCYKYTVATLQEFIGENRSYQSPQSEY